MSKIWHAVAGLYLYVCPAGRSTLIKYPNDNNLVLVSSWEFVTTLDYEWSVIRKHRPFRWTIWVGISALFLLGFVAQARVLDYSFPFGRSTPLRAYSALSL